MAIKKEAKSENKEKLAVKSDSAADDGLDKLKVALEKRRMDKIREESLVDKPDPSPPVSLGPAGAIVDALINTSPEKLLELTDFDRNQVSLVPQVVVIDDMWDYMEQLLAYRMDKNQYLKVYRHRFPETPDTSGKFVHVLAQCRRSLGGKMKKALEDMALAELETKSMDDGTGVDGHDFTD
jgi:hypothetical protein